MSTGVHQLPEGQAAKLLQKCGENAHGRLENFRRNVEAAFDDSMERASGWYKRKVQVVLVCPRRDRFRRRSNVDAVYVARGCGRTRR